MKDLTHHSEQPKNVVLLPKLACDNDFEMTPKSICENSSYCIAARFPTQIKLRHRKKLTEVSQSITNKKLGQRQQHRPYKNFRFLIAITIVCFFVVDVNGKIYRP